MKPESRTPAVIASKTAGIIWCALSALVIVALVSSRVVAPNDGRAWGYPVASIQNLWLASYATLNAFVAFRLARLKRWAFLAFPVVLLPWLLYAGAFLLMADLAVSLRRLVAITAALAVACALTALGAYPLLRADGLLRRGA